MIGDRPIEFGRYKRLMIAATVALGCAYAWMASYSAAPRCRDFAGVFAQASVHERGSEWDWSRYACDPSSDGARLKRAAAKATSVFVAIGGFARPIAFMLDRDRPERYAVASDRIEMGSRAFESEGQTLKAIFKAWTLQNAGREIVASAARVETVSDALYAMAEGRFELEDPRTGARASYGKAASPRPWLGSLVSVRGACAVGWAPLEMAIVCDEIEKAPAGRGWADVPSELALRPIVGALIWSAYAQLSALDQIRMLRAWADWLRAPAGRRANVRPETLAQWRTWLADEFEFLVPPLVYPATRAVEPLGRLVAEARLAADSPMYADFVAFRSGRPVRMPAGLDRSWTGAEALESGDARLLPGQAVVSARELESLETRDLIWESCEPPDVAHMRKRSRSRRILYVQHCDEGDVAYGGYLRYGGETFARENPSLSFVHLHGASIDFLVAKQLIKASDSVLSLVHPSEGLLLRGAFQGEATWLPRPGAYRVSSALDSDALFRIAQ